MKINEILGEGKDDSVRRDVELAVPDTSVLPDLPNQDPYLQYRMGLAIAAARAHNAGHIDFDETSAWGENMVVTAYSEEDDETLDMALKLMPGLNARRRITTPGSDEMPDVNKTSTTLAKKKNRYGV